MGGILLGYLASALWVGETGGWRNMYGAAFVPALILAAGMVSSNFLCPFARLLRHALPCCAFIMAVFLAAGTFS